MAASHRARQGVSVHTYYRDKGLTVRLEYDHREGKQSVFLNERLTSSFLCPPGKLGVHLFRATDSEADETGYLGEYRVHFAVEPDTYQIRFEIDRKNTGAADDKWYWYDRNVEPSYWSRFSSSEQRTQSNTVTKNQGVCPIHGIELVCRECESERDATLATVERRRMMGRDLVEEMEEEENERESTEQACWDDSVRRTEDQGA